MSTGVGSPFRSFSPFESLEYGKHITQVFAGSGAFAKGPCRALLIGSGGTLNIFDATSVAGVAVPFPTGQTDLSIQEVRSGGTAASIWAIY